MRDLDDLDPSELRDAALRAFDEDPVPDALLRDVAGLSQCQWCDASLRDGHTLECDVRGALCEARAALAGDSNDGEHDALAGLVHHVERFLGEPRRRGG